jgi:hypothetical protein
MKFHQFKSWWDIHKKDYRPFSLKQAYSRYANYLRSKFATDKAMHAFGHLSTVESQARWHQDLRPYYKVYPCIVDALCKLKLNFKYECPDVPEETICIRFAEGHEPKTTRGDGIAALLVHSARFDSPLFDVDGEKKGLYIQVTPLLGKPDLYWFFFDPSEHMTVEECLNQSFSGTSLPDGRLAETMPEKHEVRKLAARIALTVCMLDNDPEIITRDVLIEEQNKYDKASEEWRRKAEKRAKKEGRVGWSIGKNVQVSPHSRRPHFALRYTGPGRTIPKFVPVKFCLVHRNKLTKVPTGRMLEDGTEVEK